MCDKRASYYGLLLVRLIVGNTFFTLTSQLSVTTLLGVI